MLSGSARLRVRALCKTFLLLAALSMTAHDCSSQVASGGGPAATASDGTLTIGVLAKRGRQVCVSRWQPTVDYLNEEIPSYRFQLAPLDFDEVRPSVAAGKIDFILANSSMYVQLEVDHHVTRIATLRNRVVGKTFTEFAGVIFCRAAHGEWTNVADLRGRAIAAVNENSFGGWQMAWRELREHDIDPYRDLGSLTFSGTHDAVVHAVRDGEAEVGIVRSDTLERMATEGRINLDDFRVLHAVEDQRLPFRHSTRAYPEWPMAKLPHVPDRQAELVAAALIRMSPNDPAADASHTAGWTVPLSYQPVHDCLRELTIGPYNAVGAVTVWEAASQHPGYVATVLGLLLLASVTAVISVWLNRRLRGSERRHRLLFESSRDAIVVLEGPEWRFISANPAALEMFGASDEEQFRSLGIWDVAPDLQPDGRSSIESAREMIDEALRAGSSVFEWTHQRLDGTQFPATVLLTAIPDAGRLRVQGTVRDITEKKRQEAKLRAHQQRLQLAIAGGEVGMWDWDIVTDKVVYNERWAEMKGYTSDELGSTLSTWEDLVHPDDLAQAYEALERHFRGDVTSYEAEFRMKHKSGEWIWILDRGKVVERDEEGNPLRVCGTHLDITERKEAEAVLHQREEQLAAIYDNAPAVMMLVDEERRVHQINANGVALAGRDAEELIGLRTGCALGCADAPFAPEKKACADCALQRCVEETIANGACYHQLEMRHQFEVGGEIQELVFLLSTTPLTLRASQMALVSLLDITERKQARDALEQSEERLRAIFNGVQDGVMVAEADSGDLLRVNPRVCEMLGYETQELVELRVDDIHPEDELDYVLDLFDKQAAGEIVLATDVPFKRRNGDVLWCDVNAHPIILDGRECALGVIRDATERRRYEEQLRTLTAIVEQSEDAIISTDAEFSISYMNPAAEWLLGWTQDELFGERPSVFSASPDDHGVREAVDRLLERGQSYTGEMLARRKTGDTFWCELRLFPIVDSEGVVAGYACHMRDITERRDAQNRLRENEKQLEAIYESAPVTMLLMDAKRRVRRANGSAAAFTGRTDSELIGLRGGEALHCLHADDHPQGCGYSDACEDCPVRSCVEETIETGKTHHQVEATAKFVIDEEPQELTFLLSTTPLELDGEPMAVASLLDITDRIEAKEALQRSEHKYRTFVENARDIVFEVNPEGIFQYVSPNWEEALGHAPENVVGRSFADYVHPDDVSICADYLERVLAGDVPKEGAEYRVQHVDGQWRWHLSNGSVRSDENGDPVSFVGIARDTTERRNAQKALRESQERLELATAGTGIGIWDYDVVEDRLEWDENMFQLFGLAREEFNHSFADWAECVLPEALPDAEAEFQAALRGEKEFAIDFPIRRPDGEIRYLAAAAFVRRDDSGAPVRVVGVNMDISERKRAEQELEQANAELDQARREAIAAVEAKSSFLARMSHEIRTPMNGVIGMLDLSLETDLNREQREFLQIAESSAQSLLAIINDILDFSKIEAGELELENVVFDIGQVIEDAAATAAPRATEKGLEMACHVTPEVPPLVQGDPTRLRQILLNLINNAVKFTAQGMVTIRVTDERFEDDRCWLLFSVEDTGKGIPRQAQEHIFASFKQEDESTTRNHGGTGLGLAIVKQLVDAMGGAVWVDSEPGKGSTFSFRLPLQIAEDREQAPASCPGELEEMRVLVVDDNETNRRILTEYVRAWGCETATAPDALGALTKLREASDDDGFRLVLADAQMPGIDGFELTRLISEDASLSDVLVLMISSLGGGIAERAKKVGAAGYVSKPIRRSGLYDAIVGALQPGAASLPLDDAPDRKPTGRSLRILLAEDNRINQQVAVNTLTRCGHAVEAVETGAAALDALEADEYDVVLMDIEMPEMDGIEATRRMRKDERFVDLPVIALTAHALAKDRDRCLAAGMDAYISKPFNRQKMLDTLAELTGDTTRGGEQPPDSWSRPESEAELPIDADALIDTAGGDRDFAISLVEEFLQMTRQQLLKMQTAIKDSDYEELQTIGHSLKGAAGTVHAQRLSETAERLEDAAAERDCDSVKAIRCAIQDEVSALEVWAAANLEHGEPPLGRAS